MTLSHKRHMNARVARSFVRICEECGPTVELFARCVFRATPRCECALTAKRPHESIRVSNAVGFHDIAKRLRVAREALLARCHTDARDVTPCGRERRERRELFTRGARFVK